MNPLQVVYVPDFERCTPAYGLATVMGTAGWWPGSQRAVPSFVDVTVHFAEARGIPKLDIGSESDPYFVATLSSGSSRICYRSRVIKDNPDPQWNDYWTVRNVPSGATLAIEVYDKDFRDDDHVGGFSTSILPTSGSFAILGPLGKQRGTFWLQVYAAAAVDSDPARRPFIFDGPIRYARHSSRVVGSLVHVNDEGLYCAWRMYLRGVRLFFDGSFQPWNPQRTMMKGLVQAAASTFHKVVYSEATVRETGIVNGGDFMFLLRGAEAGSPFTFRVKPAVYTYVITIEDESMLFSETGAAFFVDKVSKHASHANSAKAVYYAGEFHPRPVGGWGIFNDRIPDHHVRWELVFDNSSGTYSPDPAMLYNLRLLLEHNFTGITICTMDFRARELRASKEACLQFATSRRASGGVW